MRRSKWNMNMSYFVTVYESRTSIESMSIIGHVYMQRLTMIEPLFNEKYADVKESAT